MRILTVCSSSTFELLASLASLKGVLEITSTGDDELMTKILTRATKAAERYVGRTLRKQVYSEKIAGFGSLYLQVSQTPVQSIAQLLKDTSVVSTTEYELTTPDEGSLYRRYGWLWSAGTIVDLEPHVMPGSEQLDFTVDYTAGYVPSTSTSTELGVPEDLEHAILEIGKAWYKQRKSDPTVTSKKVGDLELTYGGSRKAGDTPGMPGDLPATATAILKRYQRPF